jgi:hypothetical protein
MSLAFLRRLCWNPFGDFSPIAKAAERNCVQKKELFLAQPVRGIDRGKITISKDERMGGNMVAFGRAYGETPQALDDPFAECALNKALTCNFTIACGAEVLDLRTWRKKFINKSIAGFDFAVRRRP